MIKTVALSKQYGRVCAVKELSLEIKSGEIYGFLGPNGSGKTTTMRMLLGLLTPSEGSAEVLGYDVVSHPEEVRRNVGYMSQKFSKANNEHVLGELRLLAH